LPSKEELISKLMFVINAQAQRIVTVINAVPRNLAVGIKQIGDQKTDAPAAEQKTKASAEQTGETEEYKTEETTGQVSEQSAGTPEDAAPMAQNDEQASSPDMQDVSDAAPEAEKSE